MGVMPHNSIDFNISVRDTNTLKGIAICGMLCWHLFYCSNPIGITFAPIVKYIGLLGNFCVSAFLFASGYGLAVNYEKSLCDGEKDFPLKFIVKRILKFYLNYWPIFIIGTLLGVLVFNIPISNGSFVNQLKLYIFNLFALAGHSSYNSNWWFNTLILLLYIFFPFLYLVIKKSVSYAVALLIITLLLKNIGVRLFSVDAGIYTFVYVLGIAWGGYRTEVSNFLQKHITISMVIIVFLFLIPMFILPIIDNGYIYSNGIILYAMFTIGLMLLTIIFLRKNVLFSFLGKHSANIYLIHKFIYYYWFSDFIFSFKYPIIIFMVTISLSLCCSFIYEHLKTLIKYHTLQTKIITFVEKYF